MSKFQPGNPGGPGRPKGSVSKKTRLFRDRLLAHGCDIDAELAKAILGKEIEMIKALHLLLGYLAPKLKDVDEVVESDGTEDASGKPTSELLKSIVK